MHRVDHLINQFISTADPFYHTNPNTTSNNNNTVNRHDTAASNTSQQNNTTLVGRTSGVGTELLNNKSTLRWDGWGYNDTAFHIDNINTNHHHQQQHNNNDNINSLSGQVRLLGTRYLFSGKTLPSLRQWMESKVGIDITSYKPGRATVNEYNVPVAVINNQFMSDIQEQYKRIDSSDESRLFHSHGHTCQEIYALRYGKFHRIVDCVIYPANKQHVQHIVAAAHKHNVVIIPYGGGTSVSQALICPSNESRMIISLDMHGLNTIQINRYNLTAVIGAGCVGKDLENYLQSRGLTMGHEPDSMEFSTLGGWISTRASGMRKNKYGNIEDIVISAELITPNGTLLKQNQSPRVSHGPDINHIILGSEGILGVITEATVKIRPLPKHTQYGSIIFPNFTVACEFMYAVQYNKCAPVSVRLVDNMQFQFGMALKPPTNDWYTDIKSKIQKWYVTRQLKFNPDEMCAATLLFEGTHTDIKSQEYKLYTLAKQYGGVKAGEENGIRGYFLTYMIAYLRDFGFNYNFIAESFETSIPWNNVELVCQQTKQAIIDKASECGIQQQPFVSCRVTQLYDTGACVYFYFGFISTGLTDPIDTFNQIEHCARDEIMKYGGSLSHHHGIGKLRKYATRDVVGDVGIKLLQSVKQHFDPNNIFASGNLIDC